MDGKNYPDFGQLLNIKDSTQVFFFLPLIILFFILSHHLRDSHSRSLSAKEYEFLTVSYFN